MPIQSAMSPTSTHPRFDRVGGTRASELSRAGGVREICRRQSMHNDQPSRDGSRQEWTSESGREVRLTVGVCGRRVVIRLAGLALPEWPPNERRREQGKDSMHTRAKANSTTHSTLADSPVVDPGGNAGAQALVRNARRLPPHLHKQQAQQRHSQMSGAHAARINSIVPSPPLARQPPFGTQ